MFFPPLRLHQQISFYLPTYPKQLEKSDVCEISTIYNITDTVIDALFLMRVRRRVASLPGPCYWMASSASLAANRALC